MRIYRFEQHSEYEGKKRQYQGTFLIKGGLASDAPLVYCCDVYGSCIASPTYFRSSPDSKEPVFTMAAKGKVLNNTYYLTEGDETGARFATITSKGRGFRWKLLDGSEAEVARFIEPSSLTETILRRVLSGVPDAFVVLKDEELIRPSLIRECDCQVYAESVSPKLATHVLAYLVGDEWGYKLTNTAVIFYKRGVR